MMLHMKISLILMLILSSFLYAQEESNRAKILFKQCAGCHGQDGKNKAFGKSGIIAGQKIEDLLDSLKFYRDSEFKVHSTSLVMSKQVKNMNIQDLNEIATYISTLAK